MTLYCKKFVSNSFYSSNNLQLLPREGNVTMIYIVYTHTVLAKKIIPQMNSEQTPTAVQIYQWIQCLCQCMSASVL